MSLRARSGDFGLSVDVERLTVFLEFRRNCLLASLTNRKEGEGASGLLHFAFSQWSRAQALCLHDLFAQGRVGGRVGGE
jgi:hypothetical protein